MTCFKADYFCSVSLLTITDASALSSPHITAGLVFQKKTAPPTTTNILLSEKLRPFSTKVPQPLHPPLETRWQQVLKLPVEIQIDFLKQRGGHGSASRQSLHSTWTCVWGFRCQHEHLPRCVFLVLVLIPKN